MERGKYLSAKHTTCQLPRWTLHLGSLDVSVQVDTVSAFLPAVGFFPSVRPVQQVAKVINAASELIVEVLGEAGRHTRAALGANALPFSVTVEIMAVALVRTA